MKLNKWIFSTTLAVFLSSGSVALAQGHGKGHDKHGENGDRDDRDSQDDRFYRDHDREELRGWYDSHRDRLPSGLAKKDRLPPGLERQLVRRGSLPPGLQKRIQPCPEELERRLPPPPRDCVHVLIGGHLVLLNRRSNLIVDVFHFELR